MRCRKNLREPGNDQVVLPKSLQARVLRLAHYHVQSGHPGQNRLHRRLWRKFYWPHMAADVATTVHECESCAKNRIRLMKQANKLKLFPATTPLECVAIDILGPLPKSKDGYHFILVVTDRSTKLTHAFPLKKIKADDVAVMLSMSGSSSTARLISWSATMGHSLSRSSSSRSATSCPSTMRSPRRITRRPMVKPSGSIGP